MKRLWIICLVLLSWDASFAETSINVPYADFKELYRESLETKWAKEAAKDPFMYSVDRADYTMTLTSGGALCDVVIQGSVISGTPMPIPLFDTRIIIKTISQVNGGALMNDHSRENGIAFLPLFKEPFDIALTVYIPAGEDNRSGYVSLAIPLALKNSLTLRENKGLTITETPGVKDTSGAYFFSPRPSLHIRFKEHDGNKAPLEKRKSLSSRYKTVETPTMVLDSLYCFTSFSENGNALTVIKMTIPPEAGEFLKINSPAPSTIWNYRVNGKKMKVFSPKDKDDVWILPLAQNKPSSIELSLLGKGEKMGLSGRLSWTLPSMGFPVRTVNMALALPERVELTTVQGSVSHAPPFPEKPPEAFTGKPYYFSRLFYKGEGITMAVSYKEPVK